MTLYAVVYRDASKMKDIIPDLVFFDLEKAKRAAQERAFLTGLEDEETRYDVVKLTVQDEVQSETEEGFGEA